MAACSRTRRNDGIVSTASLVVVGVAAAEAGRQDVLVAGVAGLVAGALSMAAGEYVSVSSQADTEQADRKRERHELATEPQAEEDELTGIYVRRGLKPELARSVARQLTANGAVAAHARDESRPDRGARRSSVAGSTCIGGDLRRWRGGPDIDDPVGTGKCTRPSRGCSIAVALGVDRRDRGTHRWRTDVGRRSESHGVGCAGHARDNSGRKTVRHCGRMKDSMTVPPELSLPAPKIRPPEPTAAKIERSLSD